MLSESEDRAYITEAIKVKLDLMRYTTDISISDNSTIFCAWANCQPHRFTIFASLNWVESTRINRGSIVMVFHIYTLCFPIQPPLTYKIIFYITERAICWRIAANITPFV